MIHIDPAHPAFERLPRHRQAAIYFRMGWKASAVADEFGVKTETARRWKNPEAYAKRTAYQAEFQRRYRAKQKEAA